MDGYGRGDSLDIPDHLTLPQFFFDFRHHTRPKDAHLDETCLINDLSGKKVSLNEVRNKSHSIYGRSLSFDFLFDSVATWTIHSSF
jgi:hypothetical protein